MNEFKLEYWKDLDSKEGRAPDLKGQEFLSPPAEKQPEEYDRRDFLKMMGAFTALLGLAACGRRPVEKIIPYLNQPLDLVPGVPNWYSSTCVECPAACGVLVKTREGRPIKLEGNPEHPVNEGGLCARGQASLLNLYDPERLKKPLIKGEPVTWDDLDLSVSKILKGTKKIRLLTGTGQGPATTRLIQNFLKKFPDGRQVHYEAVDYSDLVRAQKDSYGSDAVPHYRLDKADLLVNFGADFLGTWISPVEFAKQFAKRRRMDGKNKLSRFVVFEAMVTLTGTNADERYPIRPGDEALIALSLAHEWIIQREWTGGGLNESARLFLKSFSIDKVASLTGLSAEHLRSLASDLWAHRGRSLILGSSDYQLQMVVNFLNSVLENDGVTIDRTTKVFQAAATADEIKGLLKEIKSGSVDVLIISGTDPVATLPEAQGFKEALKKVPHLIMLSDHETATSREAEFVLPLSNSLETWGDAEPRDGLLSIIQPTIEPLHGTRSLPEVLLTWQARLDSARQAGLEGGQVLSWYEVLKMDWEKNVGDWEKALKKGFYEVEKGLDFTLTDRRHAARSFPAEQLTKLSLKPVSSQDWHLVLYPAVTHYDGRSSSNPWLNELPDPVTKICWENYFSISPAFARAQGLEEGDIITVSGETGKTSGPVHRQVGMKDGVLAAALGYGIQTGFSLTPLMGSKRVSLSATGQKTQLASVSGHPTPEGREIIREVSLSEFNKGSLEGVKEHPSLWPKHDYKGHKWGMAIDLNTCIGCSGCVVACQAENNIPSVGKEEIIKGRELFWIQIHAYHQGEEENPDFVHQPMLCQHCENAPCETVCPTLATVHNDEGLNTQIYNRCVGTRYCSNNCPYKVRRFNWFDYAKKLESPREMVFNPDVTVREKGVMEKCSFCHQRITAAKEEAKKQGLQMPDQFFKTACQQSCPTDAILFGDLNNPESAVAKLSQDKRGYHVLDELNVKPSITYLTKVRNRE